LVITPYFAWGHVPKTGGDFTLALFHLFPELIEHADPVTSDDKHALFPARTEALAGKVLVLNVRRLPAWILSYAQHRSKFGEYPNYTPLGMLSPDEMSSLPLADEHLNNFTGNGLLTIDRWLRVESLVEDFLALIAGFIEVSTERRLAVEQLKPVNTQHYDRHLDHWFTREQISAMYRSNPIWASVESEVYGSAAFLNP
jgi:hypothetical protein